MSQPLGGSVWLRPQTPDGASPLGLTGEFHPRDPVTWRTALKTAPPCLIADIAEPLFERLANVKAQMACYIMKKVSLLGL